MPKKIFIIACEPSADSHGAALVREMRTQDPDTAFQGLGGPKMAAEGVELLHDMTTLSALGLGDVLRLYFRYRAIFYKALAKVEQLKPDAILVIDSPAFNLRFAKKIKKRFPLIYYIAPQIWAWGMRRMGVIKKTVSKMLTILPFEKALYDKAGVPCEFVGHPLLDHLPKNLNREMTRKNLGIKSGDLSIGLLAGSRKKEVLRIFPLMLESAVEIQKRCPNAVFFTRPSSNVPKSVYDKLLAKLPNLKVQILESNLHELMVGLDFALIASGTATLETALLGTPYFLLYKASRSTYFLGKYLVKVRYLGLVNLLADKRVVPEFIQNDIRPSVIADEVKRYMDHPELIREMKEDFKKVRAMLGEEGASARAARSVLSYLKTSNQGH